MIEDLDDDCNACGSSLADRQKRAAQYPGDNLSTALKRCQYCGSTKCNMCDMGDDVECPACSNAEDA